MDLLRDTGLLALPGMGHLRVTGLLERPGMGLLRDTGHPTGKDKGRARAPTPKFNDSAARTRSFASSSKRIPTGSAD